MESNNKPEEKFRVGAVSVAVWRRLKKSRSGELFESRSASLDRRYQNAAGEWASTSSLDVNDIPKAILALQKAYDYLLASDNKNGDDVSPNVVEENLR